MKKRLAIFWLLLLVLFACAAGQVKDPFAYGVYGALSTTLSSYKVILGVFTDLRAQNQVSDSAWAKFDSLANTFLDRHKDADKAMIDYKNGQISQNQAEAVMKLLTSAMQDLTNYYKAQIPADKQKPLIQ